MLYKLILVFVIGLTISRIHGQTTKICQTTFLTQFYNCIQSVSLVPQNILWFTKNGTIGTKPANEAAFKESACRVRMQIYNCSVTVMNKITASSACADSDKTSIKTFFTTIFRSYDTKCAHPCRWTLSNAFKRCHSNIGLISAPLLTDETVASVIGSDKNETALFCSNRGKLLTCMTQEKAKCPEADIVMKNIGLDLDAMKKSTDVFCSYPKVYLDSIVCFDKVSSEVQRCHQHATDEMENLSSNLRPILNESEFDHHYCTIRQKIVSCDLRAWNQSQDESKCNKAVIGLRTEYGCKLLPDLCKYIFAEKWDVICSSEEFMISARDNYGNSATILISFLPLWTVGVLVLLAI